MSVTVPPLTAAELHVMGRAAGAFLATQGPGRPDPAKFSHLARTGPRPGMQRGMWRWDQSRPATDHEDVETAAFFPAATGITAAELDVMRQSGAAFLTMLLGAPA